MGAIGIVCGTIEKGIVGEIRTMSIRSSIEIRSNRGKGADGHPDYREPLCRSNYIAGLPDEKTNNSQSEHNFRRMVADKVDLPYYGPLRGAEVGSPLSRLESSRPHAKKGEPSDAR